MEWQTFTRAVDALEKAKASWNSGHHFILAGSGVQAQKAAEQAQKWLRVHMRRYTQSTAFGCGLPVLLPLHRSRQSDLKPDLSGDWLSAYSRLSRAQV